MNATTLDLAERVGWTFLQALAGSIVAGGTAVNIGTFDWRAAGLGATTAALFALLKVLGVNASVAAQAAQAAATAVDEATSGPANTLPSR